MSFIDCLCADCRRRAIGAADKIWKDLCSDCRRPADGAAAADTTDTATDTAAAAKVRAYLLMQWPWRDLCADCRWRADGAADRLWHGDDISAADYGLTAADTADTAAAKVRAYMLEQWPDGHDDIDEPGASPEERRRLYGLYIDGWAAAAAADWVRR